MRQDSIQSLTRGNSSGKHGRRLSGTFHRRNSSALSLPPVDLLAAEAAVFQALTEDERRQLNDDGEVTRYVKACNGNQAEVSWSSCIALLVAGTCNLDCAWAMPWTEHDPFARTLCYSEAVSWQRGHDIKPANTQALKRLRATMRWRAKELPKTLLCTVCKADPKAHFMHVVRPHAFDAWHIQAARSRTSKHIHDFIRGSH